MSSLQAPSPEVRRRPAARMLRSSNDPRDSRQRGRRARRMTITRSRALASLGLLALAAMVAGMARWRRSGWAASPTAASSSPRASGSRGARSPSRGRPIDLALHPREEVFAVLNKSEVFLADRRRASGEGTSRSRSDGETSAGFRGLVWSPDGTRLFASTDRGHVQAFAYKDGKLKPGGQDRAPARGGQGQPGPRRDGDHPRRHAAVRRRGQPQRRCRGRPDDARARARVPGRDPAVRAEALGGRADAGRQQLGRPAARSPATGRPRARTSTSWSTTAGHRRRARSA